LKELEKMLREKHPELLVIPREGVESR